MQTFFCAYDIKMIKYFLILGLLFLPKISAAEASIECLGALTNILKEAKELNSSVENMISGVITLNDKGILNETVEFEDLATHALAVISDSQGLGIELAIRDMILTKSANIKDANELIFFHATAFYEILKRVKSKFDQTVPLIKNSNVRDDVRSLRSAMSNMINNYKKCQG